MVVITLGAAIVAFASHDAHLPRADESTTNPQVRAKKQDYKDGCLHDVAENRADFHSHPCLLSFFQFCFCLVDMIRDICNIFPDPFFIFKLGITVFEARCNCLSHIEQSDCTSKDLE